MDRIRPRWARLGSVCLLGSLALGLGAHAQREPEPRPAQPKALEIISRVSLPQGQSVPTDIRWATDHSVYVSWYIDGVAEVGLDGARRRQLVPNTKSLDPRDHVKHFGPAAGPHEHFDQLAVSRGTLVVVNSGFHVYSRPLAVEKGKFQLRRQDVTYALDVDLRGDRLLFLGMPIENWPRTGIAYKVDGGVAWIGTLEPELKDLRPLLRDVAWNGLPAEDEPWGATRTFYQCSPSLLGAVRFLGDGSFVVVPGFQKGVHLFNAQGEQIRAWTSEEVGLDTDCTGVSDEEEVKIRMDPSYWLGWLNAHHVIDDILPLPQGPGLLVRAVGENGQPTWTLKVLTHSRVETYLVPIVGRRRSDRLHGDVRNGRIALLLSARGSSWSRNPAAHSAEILVAEMPE